MKCVLEWFARCILCPLSTSVYPAHLYLFFSLVWSDPVTMLFLQVCLNELDVSGATYMCSTYVRCQVLVTRVLVLVGMSVRSPRKLTIFPVYESIQLVSKSGKHYSWPGYRCLYRVGMAAALAPVIDTIQAAEEHAAISHVVKANLLVKSTRKLHIYIVKICNPLKYTKNGLFSFGRKNHCSWPAVLLSFTYLRTLWSKKHFNR